LEDADQNVNQLYDVLAEEFDRQYNLLDSLGYFKQMSPDVAECGHGNISGRFECYKALESLLPEVARKLIAAGIRDSCAALIVIVTPDNVVPLKYQWSKMTAAGYPLQDDLFEPMNQDPTRMTWEDGRALPQTNQRKPYMLVGITAAQWCRASAKPTDSTMVPCDEFKKCLTLAELTALATLVPELFEEIGGAVAAGSLYAGHAQTFPIMLNLTPLPNRVFRVDIFSAEMQEMYPANVWAPRCWSRMSLPD
jgi:hypothetical protein